MTESKPKLRFRLQSRNTLIKTVRFGHYFVLCLCEGGRQLTEPLIIVGLHVLKHSLVLGDAQAKGGELLQEHFVLVVPGLGKFGAGRLRLFHYSQKEWLKGRGTAFRPDKSGV